MRKLPLICVVLAGCVDDAELELSNTESEVNGTIVVQRDDGLPPAIEDCTSEAVLPEANLVRFRNAITTDIMPKARAVARSEWFSQCLRTTIQTGQFLRVRGWFTPGTPQQFGPYSLRLDDRGAPIVQNMPIERIRALYAERLISESQGPQPLTITCMANRSGGASTGAPNPNEDRLRPEAIHLSKDFFNHDPAPVQANYPFRAFTAAVIWHEVTHERGYHHPDVALVTQDEYNNALAPIVGACMEQVFADNESYCGFAACPGGTMMLPPGGGDWGSCTCMPNGMSDQMSLVDSWDWSGIDDLAVNDAGDGYVLAWNGAARTAYKRAGHAWNAIGTATRIVAGGDAVALRQTGPGFPRALNYWNIVPRVGPSETVMLGAGDASSFAMDSFGTLYRTTSLGRVERHRPHVSGWQDIGAGTAVTAGSDLAYLVSNGQLDRFNAATGSRVNITPIASVQHATDAYGTYWGLSSDGFISRWRGTFFELIGVQDTSISTGDNLFTKSINGTVYRLAPAGWQPVAACDRYAAGGRNLYCLRGTRLELYAY